MIANYLQALLLDLSGADLLTRLIGNGPDQRITQLALYATANLAARNSAAQEALRESGRRCKIWRALNCSVILHPEQTQQVTPIACRHWSYLAIQSDCIKQHASMIVYGVILEPRFYVETGQCLGCANLCEHLLLKLCA